MGELATGQKDWQKAVGSYTLALQNLEDTFPDGKPGPSNMMITTSRFNRALAYKEIGKTKEAARDLKEYLNRASAMDKDTAAAIKNRRKEIEGCIKELEAKK